MKDNKFKYSFLLVLAFFFAYRLCVYLGFFKIDSYLSYFIILFGVLFSLYRIVIIVKQTIHAYKSCQEEVFLIKLKKSLFSSINPKLAGVVYQEMILVYFSLIRWQKFKSSKLGRDYSYHRNNTTITFYSVLLFVGLLETVILEIIFILFKITLLRYIVLVASIYSLLFLLAHIKASIYTKHYITDDKILLFNGLLLPIEILLKDINWVKINRELEEEASFKYGLIAKLESFNFQIELKKDYEFSLMYGAKKLSNNLTFYVDEAEFLQTEINQKIMNS